MKAFLLLFMLLVLVVGAAGAYNYQRNAWMDRELESFRPYKGLSDEEIDTLIDAHRSEMLTMQQSLGGGPSTSGFNRIRPADRLAKLDHFEEFQAENERWKKGYRATLDQQVMIDALRKEKELRKAERTPADRIWRRLTSLEPAPKAKPKRKKTKKKKRRR